MQSSRVQKVVTLSPQLYRLAYGKAQKLGLNFQEFVRVLITNEVKEDVEKYELVDEETERLIGQAETDIQEGRVTKLSSPEEIENYHKSL